MKREDKEELIKRIEERMPEIDRARESSYLAGKRDAFVAATLIIMDYWFGKEYGDV